MTAESDHPFLRAARREQPSHVPVWFMRQAGRSLPEYRAVRGGGSILDAIKQPDLAAEITLQPVRRHGVDAAVLYSDIVVPVHAIGFGVDVAPGVGPVIDRPFNDAGDLKRLRTMDPEVDTPYVLETVRILARELAIPLLAFAGAPFTVASYLIEGRPSRTYARTKALMFGAPTLWHALMQRLTDLAITSIRSQLDAGAQAFQLFDSWAGALHPTHYERFVMPYSSQIFEALRGKGPGIHFGVNTGELLTSMARTGCDVLGVDWRTSLTDARRRAGRPIALQGNLDPAICTCSWEIVEPEVDRVLADNGGDPGYIFNLGHGVLPETDPDVLTAIVEKVHRA
jgi:uroporphyrinogen decarboxylase